MKRAIFLLSFIFAIAATQDLQASIARNVMRSNVGGIDVLVYRADVPRVISIRGSLPAGEVLDAGDNPVVASLTASMLSKGTTLHDKYAIARMLENVGAGISIGGGVRGGGKGGGGGVGLSNFNVEFSARCLTQDLPMVISLLAEELRSPAFLPEEFEKLKVQYSSGVRQMMDSTNDQAGVAFGRAIYAENHPNHPLTADELLAAIEKVTLDDVKAFYSRHYGPAHMKLVAVGDVDEAILRREVERAFAGWTGGSALPALVRPAGKSAGPRDQTVFMAGKASVSVVLGQAIPLQFSDQDYLPMRFATAVFGSGFTGRLMATVRDREGLTYTIGATVGNNVYTEGDWKIYATFAPSLLEQGVASIRRQLAEWHDKGITAEELQSRKRNLIGGFKLQFGSTAGIASQILGTLERGDELSYLDEYPDRIKALTVDQVNAAIRNYLNPGNMVLVKAGTVTPAP